VESDRCYSGSFLQADEPLINCLARELHDWTAAWVNKIDDILRNAELPSTIISFGFQCPGITHHLWKTHDAGDGKQIETGRHRFGLFRRHFFILVLSPRVMLIVLSVS